MGSTLKQDSKTLRIPSDSDRLHEVQGFVNDCLSNSGASDKAVLQLELIVEEIFVNIASYAYNPPGSGDVEITCSVKEDKMEVVVTFVDQGPEFDPLQMENPDVTKDLRDREIGGLGIFLAKNHADEITYRREGDKNILTVEKRLS